MANLVLLLLFVASLSYSRGDAQKSSSSPSPLFPFLQNGKWGYIDVKGSVVIPPRFDAAGPFLESLAGVKTGGGAGFINEAGDIVIPPTFADVRGFSNGLAVAAIGDKCGYIDKKGQRIIDFRFLGCLPFTCDALAVVTDDSARDYNYWFIDRAGARKLGPFLMVHPFRDGLARVMPLRVGDSFPVGFVNCAGEWAVKPQYVDASDFSEGIAMVSNGRKNSLIDRAGRMLVDLPAELHADLFTFFSEGLGAVRAVADDRCGYINTDSKLVIPTQFNECAPFSDGLAGVRVADKWGYIDRQGKTVAGRKFDRADRFQSGLARVQVDDRIGYIDRRGAYVWEPRR